MTGGSPPSSRFHTLADRTPFPLLAGPALDSRNPREVGGCSPLRAAQATHGSMSRAQFRSRWGNPWGFESPRSHTPTFTKCQLKDRSGSVPSNDVRFHGAVTEQGARIPRLPRASEGRKELGAERSAPPRGCCAQEDAARSRIARSTALGRVVSKSISLAHSGVTAMRAICL